MTRYKCPKCKMEYDAPGKCDMCNVTLEKIEEKVTHIHNHHNEKHELRGHNHKPQKHEGHQEHQEHIHHDHEEHKEHANHDHDEHHEHNRDCEFQILLRHATPPVHLVRRFRVEPELTKRTHDSPV